ncbi:MAG: hypothetical protein A2X48_09835 [Lentisphaerae bacterium GWF2_49_21]|nr:MAG: hypothetical protein A2X48_09835 [Lentisphaerae bacterium GWF2_49_21]
MPKFPKRAALSWVEISRKAKAFCDEYGLAERDYPLDIEEIIEFDLGIEIRFSYGVHDDFGSPAQICPGIGKPIIIADYDQYRANSPYYRYSLAHEIGHYILHKSWLDEIGRQIDSIETQLKKLDEKSRNLNIEDILPYLAVPVSKHFGMSNSAAQARIRKSAKWKEFCS